MSISDSKLRNIKAPYTGKSELTDRDGLNIRVSKHAVITFSFRFQWCGKPQRMKLGRYPEIKLTEAREQVIKLRRSVFEGVDPRHLIEKHTEQSLLGSIATEFLEVRVNKELSKNSITLYNYTIKKYAIPFSSIDTINTC